NHNRSQTRSGVAQGCLSPQTISSQRKGCAGNRIDPQKVTPFRLPVLRSSLHCRAHFQMEGRDIRTRDQG
ncbi:hypothetical protein CEXT_270211, partial [Caerostris extrusa]